jgi:hypothetical protein
LSDPTTPEQVVDSSAVENLMQVLVKGLRAIQLYLPNNPIYHKAVGNVRTAFAPVWEELTELELRVTETDLFWEDVAVYARDSKAESVAWLLHKDGIRTLTLLPGVEEGEIVRFLEVLQKVANLPTDAADDMLTLLWEEDFQRIRYTALELAEEGIAPLEPSESGWLGSGAPDAEQVRQQVQQEAQEAASTGGIVSLEDFDSTVYFLDESEIAHLRKELEREYSQDLRGNVLSMLFDLMELQTYTAVRTELISIAENFIPYLLGVGDFRSVAYLLRELRVIIERSRELIPEHEKQLMGLPAKLSQSAALGQLLQSLDEAVVHPNEEDLGELFSELRPEALEGVIEWLPQLTNERVRSLLEAAARRLASSHPEQLVKSLESDDDTVLLQTVRLVSLVKLPPLVAAVGRHIRHKNSEIRRAVVDALAAIGSPSAMKELERGIEDSDRDVRISAVRTLSERGHRGAFARVESAVKGRSLRGSDLTEKTAFFEAYGRLAGASGISILKGMLQGKGVLRRKEDSETRACAAMALGKINDEEARAVLERTSSTEKDPLVKNAINKALQENV